MAEGERSSRPYAATDVERLAGVAQRIVYPESSAEAVEWFRLATEVDRAHVTMLAETGVLTHERALRILGLLAELRSSDFADIVDRPRPRGLYMTLEAFLIERLGAEIGGALQTGRSRNDLNATVQKLRARGPFLRLSAATLRLQAALLRAASRHGRLVMPLYTHYQPAVPATYGQYMAGVAAELDASLAGLIACRADLSRSPLGAGAGGGTSVPIDAERTAALLGFGEAPSNSIAAVASRDWALRLLAHATILGVTLSRVATDMLWWSSSERRFLWLPDRLVGGSSMMPQKRNPFLLEHVQGLSAEPFAAFAGAVAAMQKTPFSNSIAVGVYGTGNIVDALESAADAAELVRLVVSGARLCSRTAATAAEAGYTASTELANRLALSGELGFRSAHELVAEVVLRAMEAGQPLSSAALQVLPEHLRDAVSLDALEAEAVALSTDRGGGPAPATVATQIASLRGRWFEHAQRRRALATKWRSAAQYLDAAVRRLGD